MNDSLFNEHARDGKAQDLNVTSRAMTGAERVRLHRQRKAAEQLRYTSDEWRAFVDPDSLQRKAGASWENMPPLVLKEAVDNAVDAARGSNAWIETVMIDGAAWWCIGDHGDGIRPDQVTRVFAVNRPMESTKHVRRVSRGQLGNGTRVIAGFCAIKDLRIMVESHNVRSVLRIDKATGRTELQGQEPIANSKGTRVYLPRLAGLAKDGVDALAQQTLALSKLAPNARAYNGPSNPWWYGSADLLRLLVTAPAGTSVGDVVRDLGLKLPRGIHNGLAAEATDERAALLLRVLRERYIPVEAAKIGRCGRDAFEDQFPGYALKATTSVYQSGAEVPAVIEAWAVCDGWKKRDLAVTAKVDTYLNRSACLSGIKASGRREGIWLQGAGIGWTSIEAKSGRYQIVISIITPQARLLSDGKAPDFSYLSDSIAEVIGKAMRSARRGVPPDDATPEELAEAKREAEEVRRRKEAKAERTERNRQQRESDQILWRSITGARPLLRTIESSAETFDYSLDDLTVGDPRHDPFRMDIPANHRIGQWLAEHMPKGRTIHLRGLHYLLVSTTALVRPDGTPYQNDLSCWQWLQNALNAARWLRYVGFDQIEDERNAQPIWAPASNPAGAADVMISEPMVPSLPKVDDLLPHLSMTWRGTADRQRYHLCLLGEKTGLRPILEPLAVEYGTDLLLPSGEPSITMLYNLVQHAIRDGRPLVILTFTDLDPTGYGIPASVARKVQALLALSGSDLHVRVIPAALTVEQARSLGLPSTPLKHTERRADRWRKLTGRDQTEIDALAGLEPAVLVQIARDAIAPFYDANLAKRAQEARQQWEEEARKKLIAQLNRTAEHGEACAQLDQQHADTAKAMEALCTTIGNLHKTMGQAAQRARLPKLPKLPAWKQPQEKPPAALFDSAHGFVVNTRKLRSAKLHNDDDGRPTVIDLPPA